MRACHMVRPEQDEITAAPRARSHSRRREQSRDRVLRFPLYPLQMLIIPETFGINFINVFRPGRPRGEPTVLRDHLDPANRRAVTRSGIQDRAYWFTGELPHAKLLGREILQQRLLRGCRRRVDPLVERHTQFAREIIEDLARIPPSTRGDFGGEQSGDEPVLVCRPNRAVSLQKRCPGALLPGEPERAAEQAIDEPFESDRHLDQHAAKFRGDAIDDAAADDGLADTAASAPSWTMTE